MPIPLIPVVLGAMAGAGSFIASTVLGQKSKDATSAASGTASAADPSINPGAAIGIPGAAANTIAAPASNGGGAAAPPLQAQINPLPQPVQEQPVQETVAQTQANAVVTTNDPPPSGDLIVRDSPNGNQIGGADKGGIVVMNSASGNDGTWQNITWSGGRWPAITGFVKKQYLRSI